MKFNAAILFAIPALIAAAPMPVGSDVTLVEPVSVNEDIFARYAQTCNPPKLTNADEIKVQKAALADMSAATKRAHTAEVSAPCTTAITI